MAGAEWFYGKDNKQHGPVSAVQLKELAQMGEVRPTDLVWREGMSDWMPASRVKGLFEPVAEAPPARAPSEPEPPAVSETDLPQVIVSVPPRQAVRKREPSAHLFERMLEGVRGRLSQRFAEATAAGCTLAGHYGLYLAILLLAAFAIIAGVKTRDLGIPVQAVSWAVALAVLQYVAARFFKTLDALDRATTVSLGSPTLPDCFALVAMTAGVIVPVQLGVFAVQTGVYVVLLPAVALLALLQYVALASLHYGWLNVTIDAGLPAADEALGIIGFVVKLCVRLVPVAFGVGVACGLLVLAAGIVLFVAAGADRIASIPLHFAAGLLCASAALPVAGYVVFAIVQLVVAFVGRFR